MPTEGRPRGTAPSVAMPWSTSFQCQLTTIDPTTAISAPGIFFDTILPPTITTMTDTDTASVGTLVSPTLPKVWRNLRIVPPEPADTPSIPATCPMATCTP